MEGRVKTEEAKEPLPVRFVSGHGFLRRAARDLGRAVSEYIPRIAVPISPYRFAARHVFYVFLSLLAAPAGVLLALAVHWSFLLLLITPLVSLFLPWLRLKTMVGDRKRAAGDELPFFAVHSAIAQSAGLSLYESLISTIGREVFDQVEKGATAAKRNVKVLGMGPLRAIEELGRNHPHNGMRTLLLGYTSEWRSGGDVTSYLESKADEYLRRTRHRWEEYKENVSVVAEIILTFLLIVPLVVLMAVFMSTGAAFTMGLGFAVVGIPLVVGGSAALIYMSQPKDYTDYEGNPYLSSLAFPLAFAAAASFLSPWVALAVSLGAGFAAYGLPVLVQRRRSLREEEALPQFLRDMTEYQKLNYPMKKVAETLWREHTYNDRFDELLGHVVKQLKMGRRFSELEVPTRSWLTKLSFFHLGQVAESGGIATKPMELLTGFITRVKEARDDTRSSLRMYLALAVATPFTLTLIVGMMTGVLTSFQMPEVAASAPGMGGSSLMDFSVPSTFDALSRMIVLFSSVGIGFLMSYASDLTARNTCWVALNSFLAAAAMALLPSISSWVSGFFGI